MRCPTLTELPPPPAGRVGWPWTGRRSGKSRMFERLVASATRQNGQRLAWVLLALAAVATAVVLVWVPFPQSVGVVFIVPVTVAIWHSMQLGICIWLVVSVLGNWLQLDLPGIPPLRPTHLVLLLLLMVWFVKSYRDIPAALSRFLGTAKNKVLVALLGWVALSMVMGRVTGVTQQTWQYQFNAWFSVGLAIALAVIVSSCLDERLLKAIVWLTLVLGTALTVAVLVAGYLDGLGLWDWKAYYYRFFRDTGLVYVSALYVALVFFSDQKWWGKALSAAGIAVSSVLTILMALDGSRSNLFPLVSIGFVFLFGRPRLLLIFGLLVVVPVVALNATALETWAGEQVEYTVREGMVIGRGARIGLWLDALETIQRHPLWGTGSDFYRDHANVRVVATDAFWNPVAKWSTDAHNTWLQAAVDHGIPGAVLLAVFFVCVLKDVWSLHWSVEHVLYRRYALLFLAGFCTTICTSLVGEAVLPVFTATHGNEEIQLARYLVGFWLSYGVLLGVEQRVAACG